MTLILSCLTEDCIYQVSDRRLTSFDPPRTPINDETNKALLVNGRVVFGYTGISKVAGENTDLWLTRVAASSNSMDMTVIARCIQDQATKDFNRMTFASRFKRHAFQGAGWFRNKEGPGLVPGIITIENAFDPASGDWLPYARPRFEMKTVSPILHRAQLYLTSVGLRLTTEERSAVYRLLRKCVHRRVRKQEATLYSMIYSMRWLHRRYEPNSLIGPNLMAISIPRVAAERVIQTGKFIAIAGGPASETCTFLDVNISGRVHVVGPHVVFGGSALTGFQAGPIAKGK